MPPVLVGLGVSEDEEIVGVVVLEVVDVGAVVDGWVVDGVVVVGATVLVGIAVPSTDRAGNWTTGLFAK